jgi:hypothetical protein
MTPIHFETQRGFWLLRALGAAGMATIGAIWVVKAGLGSFQGWFSMLVLAFGGVGAVVGIREGTRRGPRLTLDERGLHDRSLGVGVIEWSDITRASPYWMAKKPFVALELRDPAKYVARASRFKQLLARQAVANGLPPFSVNLVGVNADATKVAELIMSRRRSGAPGTLAASSDEADESHDDDLHDAEPPTPHRVARRALVLAALACRSALEKDAGNTDAERFRRDVLAWLGDVGALAEAEPGERRILEAPLGALDEQRVIDASWRGEGLAVLAWALRRAELPSYGKTAISADVATALGFMRTPAESVLAAPTLRSPAEIETLARRLFALHWRLREFTLRPRAMDFATFARTARFGPLDIEGLELASGDLAIDGRPLLSADPHRVDECLGIARERQQAANWLRGDERLYSDVGADT